MALRRSSRWGSSIPGSSILLVALGLAGCAAWRPVERYERWTLYVQEARPVDAARFHEAFEPAFHAVETALGPFAERVDVYAWDGGVRLGEDGLLHGEEGLVQDVPGIGPMQVRAFHARKGGGLFEPTGVFVGTADTGTAVHELVHARLDELGARLPLWLEEGLATLLGDGFVDGESWVVDGLACWPLRQLAEQRLDEAEVKRLLRLRGPDLTPRDNVLVHFVGWAVAFDLYRETGTTDWRAWLARLGQDPAADAPRRYLRTLDPDVPLAWLAALDDDAPARRLAAAKGVWKLRSRAVVERLLERLAEEEDDEVKVGLALNALGAVSETRVGRSLWWNTWRLAMPVLEEAQLDDPGEQRAIRDLYSSYRRRRSGWNERPTPEESMRVLARFWEE
jgi:hypothetical protein